MSIDHTRSLPVHIDRLNEMAKLHASGYAKTFWECEPSERREILQIVLLGELVEQQQQVAFFLQEAYDIYNNRFR